MAQEHNLSITPNAAKRVVELISQEGNDKLMLRLSVSGGGCSGFQYGITLDDKTNEDDIVLEQHGVRVVLDESSLSLMEGTQVDFVEDMMGASFQFSNPNATSTCGCGTSFSV